MTKSILKTVVVVVVVLIVAAIAYNKSSWLQAKLNGGAASA